MMSSSHLVYVLCYCSHFLGWRTHVYCTFPLIPDLVHVDCCEQGPHDGIWPRPRFGNKVILFDIRWIISHDSDVFYMEYFGKKKTKWSARMFHALLYISETVCFRFQVPSGGIRKVLSSSSHTHVLRTRPHWITSSPAPSLQSHGESEALAPLSNHQIRLTNVRIWVCRCVRW